MGSMPKKTKKPKIIRKRADSYVEVYTNNAHIQFSYYDFIINFGQSVDFDDNTNTGIVSDSVALRMSPEYAKALHEALGGNLEIYERNYGPIRTTPA